MKVLASGQTMVADYSTHSLFHLFGGNTTSGSRYPLVFRRQAVGAREPQRAGFSMQAHTPSLLKGKKNSAPFHEVFSFAGFVV